eukprot:TRINITY_DN12701_c0_g1_i1.p1 TRINITY_DN12701_c0_g1~~TRINITY_DN12701_c0_g1_i1.p1  ORF type:complete len:405 (-),score=59.07 TRINITY_DN12701_c0_g1_i1:28-1128(-)
MATNQYPYNECHNAVQVYKRVTSGQKSISHYKIKDKELLRFLDLCICDASVRKSAKELLQDPFLEPTEDDNQPIKLYDVDEHERILKDLGIHRPLSPVNLLRTQPPAPSMLSTSVSLSSSSLFESVLNDEGHRSSISQEHKPALTTPGDIVPSKDLNALSNKCSETTAKSKQSNGSIMAPTNVGNTNQISNHNKTDKERLHKTLETYISTNLSSLSQIKKDIGPSPGSTAPDNGIRTSNITNQDNKRNTVQSCLHSQSVADIEKQTEKASSSVYVTPVNTDYSQRVTGPSLNQQGKDHIYVHHSHQLPQKTPNQTSLEKPRTQKSVKMRRFRDLTEDYLIRFSGDYSEFSDQINQHITNGTNLLDM